MEKTEFTDLKLRDAAGTVHVVTMKIVSKQAGGLLGGTTDIWEEKSRTYALADKTRVISDDDGNDTFTAMTKPPKKLWPITPRV